MSNCMCEPHASGSNRCAVCRVEDRQAYTHREVIDRLSSAVDLIRELGCNYTALHRDCSDWLEANGYDSLRDWQAKRARELRAEALDDEIERLRAERAKL